MSSRSRRDLGIEATTVTGCLGALVAFAACSSANRRIHHSNTEGIKTHD
jgi:hypothetical protein